MTPKLCSILLYMSSNIIYHSTVCHVTEKMGKNASVRNKTKFDSTDDILMLDK